MRREYCWTNHTSNLFSMDVANLALTSFPQSAIDCAIECQCGVESSRRRIIGGVESDVCTKYSICYLIEYLWIFLQPQRYPWIAAMIKDRKRDASYIRSHCSAILVCINTHKTNKIHLFSAQIGSRWMVTAAHCLYDSEEYEPLPDDSFSVMLGLHDRSKNFEATR